MTVTSFRILFRLSFCLLFCLSGNIWSFNAFNQAPAVPSDPFSVPAGGANGMEANGMSPNSMNGMQGVQNMQGMSMQGMNGMQNMQGMSMQGTDGMGMNGIPNGFNDMTGNVPQVNQPMPQQNGMGGNATVMTTQANRSLTPADITVSRRQAFFLQGDGYYIVKMPQNGQMQEIINLPAGRSYMLIGLPNENDLVAQQNSYDYISQTPQALYQPVSLPISW